MTNSRISQFVVQAATIGIIASSISCKSESKEMLVKRLQAQRLCDSNLTTIRQAAAGKPFELKELTQALDFMSSATGITSRDEGTFVGRVPNEHLQEDLKKWEQWYSTNKGRIYLDNTGKIAIGG